MTGRCPWPALVLAAGLGTRLRPLSAVRAKAALPVAGRPLIIRILSAVARGRHRPGRHQPAPSRRNHHAGGRRRHAGRASRCAIRGKPHVLGSGGGPARALPLLAADRFFIVNGDTLSDMSFERLAEAHRRSGADATLAVAPADLSKYNALLADETGAFVGIAPRGTATPGHRPAAPGTSSASRQSTPRRSRASTRTRPERFAARRLRAAACPRGRRRSRVFPTERRLLRHRHAGGLPADDPGDCPRRRRVARVRRRDASSRLRARIEHSVLWDRVTVGESAELSHCIVTDDVTIPAGARYHRAVITPRRHRSPLSPADGGPAGSGVSRSTAPVRGRAAAWSRSPATRPIGDTSASSSRIGASIVLALHAGPIDVDTLPFVSVARLMRAIPLPVPAILHGSNELGVLGLDDLGDVTLQAHLGVASPAEHAALYRQAVEFIATLQQRGAALASRRVSAVWHRVRRREADLGAGVLRQALSGGLSRRCRCPRRSREALQARVGGHRRASSPASRGCCATAITTAAT